MEVDGKKFIKQKSELLEQAVDLEQSKIDLNVFKEAAEKAKNDRWIKSVRDHAAQQLEFKLTATPSVDAYFKGDYYNEYITGITVLSKSINNHQNKILLNIERRYVHHYWSKGPETPSAYRAEEKSYIKGEKIFEILKNAGWKVDVDNSSNEE